MSEKAKCFEQMQKSLKALLGPADDPNCGWRGIGGSDVLFACEYCGAKHEDCTQVPHTGACPIPAARAALANTERKTSSQST